MDPTDWLPFYPDLLPRRRSMRWPHGASQPPYTTAIFPVTDVLASLTFLPSYPDQVPHTRTLREGSTFVSGAVEPIATLPLAWLPTYPDRVPHRRLPAAGMPWEGSAPPGAQVVVAQSLAWQARYPARVPHRRPLQPGGAFEAIFPGVAAAGEPCVDLGLEDLTAPALVAASLTTPALTGEGLGSPALIDEDLCP